MKRTWKNLKIDKNKVYMRIGQAVTYIAFDLLLSVFFYWVFLQGMTYQEGKEMMKNKNKELSQKDNPFKYFWKLTLIALFFIGISIVFLTYIIRVLLRI